MRIALIITLISSSTLTQAYCHRITAVLEFNV